MQFFMTIYSIRLNKAQNLHKQTFFIIMIPRRYLRLFLKFTTNEQNILEICSK